MNFTNFKNFTNSKKHRGDAVILLSVLVSGLVILISSIAAQNLKKSAEIQGVQKKSLKSLYEAEEGVENGLFLAKNSARGSNQNDNYQRFIKKIWKKIDNNFTEVGENERDMALISRTPKDKFIIVEIGRAHV